MQNGLQKGLVAANSAATKNSNEFLEALLTALKTMGAGDFSTRMATNRFGVEGEISNTFNEIAAANERMVKQLGHVRQVVGREGKTRQRLKFGLPGGAWADMEGSVNALIDDLLWPMREMTRAIAAVAQGDLLETVKLDVKGRPLKGEFLRSASIVNTMIKRLRLFTSETMRVAREVGAEGKPGGQAQVPEGTGAWKDLTDSINAMCGNLTAQVRNIAQATAQTRDDFPQNIASDVRSDILMLKNTINTIVEQLNSFTAGMKREVDGDGKLGSEVTGEVLRAKVKIFTKLYRKTRQLEQLNAELEARVSARTAELEASNVRLLESEERRNLALAAGKMGSWDWDCVANNHLWDEGQFRIFGVDPKKFNVRLDTVRRMIHPGDIRNIRAAIEKINREAQSCEVEFRIVRDNGEIHWCLCTAASTLDDNGRMIRVSGVTVDITERKKAEERQALLAREVDHRAKNALALVQSIVRLTRAESIPHYIKAVEGRITALARVHTVLANARWQGADIRGIIEEELAPYQVRDISRVSLEGPPICLQPATAQTLALTIHELATNAAKYGSLSVHGGRVNVQWSVDTDYLRLVWEEVDGPIVSTPSSRGFGTRSVIASIESQLQGEAKFDWRPAGLICRMRVPGRHNLLVKERDVAISGSRPDPAPLAFTGLRILLVEDEAVVAMTTSDILTELGYLVEGPHCRLSDAFAAAMAHLPDVAVLDVNLNGEMIYPLAEFLMERKVPLLFVTGYGAESIDQRFIGVPVLQKPLDRAALERTFPANGPPVIRSTTARYAERNAPDKITQRP